MIYILLKTYPHEFSEVLGAYSSEDGAESARTEAVSNDDSNGYNDFDIIERELS